MAAGRKIKDASEARRCLAAAKRAGLSTGQWARERGIDGRSLHAWQMNLERGSTKSRSPGRRSLRPSAQTSALVELVPTTRVQSLGTARYVVDVGVARIEFGDDATVATLGRILEALRSC